MCEIPPFVTSPPPLRHFNQEPLQTGLRAHKSAGFEVLTVSSSSPNNTRMSLLHYPSSNNKHTRTIPLAFVDLCHSARSLVTNMLFVPAVYVSKGDETKQKSIGNNSRCYTAVSSPRCIDIHHWDTSEGNRRCHFVAIFKGHTRSAEKARP